MKLSSYYYIISQIILAKLRTRNSKSRASFENTDKFLLHVFSKTFHVFREQLRFSLFRFSVQIENPSTHPMQIAWMGIYLTCMLIEVFILCWFGDKLIWKVNTVAVDKFPFRCVESELCLTATKTYF